MNLQEEQEFIRKFQAGFIPDEALLEEYYRAIRFYVYKKAFPSCAEDAYQECCIKLFDLVKQYSLDREIKFTTFLLSHLRQTITKCNRKQHCWDRRNVSLEDLIQKSNFDSPAEEAELEEFKSKFRIAVSILTETEKRLIYLRYFKELELKTISRILGIPRGSIFSMEKRALRKMKLILQSKEEIDQFIKSMR